MVMEKVEIDKKVNLALQNELQGPFSTIDTSADLILQNYPRVPDHSILIEAA